MAQCKPLSEPWTYFTALATAGVLALTACGGGEDATEDAASSETSEDTEASEDAEAPEDTVDEELAALVPDDIAEAGAAAIAVDPSYPPAEYLDTDDETVIGFNVDLIEAALAKLGLEADWVETDLGNITHTFRDRAGSADDSSYDLGASSFPITEENMNEANMVSYFSSGTQWFAQTGNPADVDPDNACGSSVAVRAASIHVDELEVLSEECEDSGEEPIAIEPFQEEPEIAESVVSGETEASLSDLPVSLNAVQESDDQLELIGEVQNAILYGIYTHEDAPETAEAVAAAFNAIIEDGTYAEILAEWDIEVGAIEEAEVNPSVED